MFSCDVLGAGERERWKFPILAGMFLAAISAISVHAENHLAIRIDSLPEVQLNTSYELGVQLEGNAGSSSLAGFDFLIAFDGTAMQMDSVAAGSALGACGWEYFTYRTSVDDYCPYPPCPERPIGLVRIVALAETNNGTPYPTCFLENPGELARLHITTSGHPDRLCNLAPVRFHWQDCGDNMVALHPNGDTLLLSDRVYWMGQRIEDPSAGFPGPYGTAGECVQTSPGSGPIATRGIDFYNGHLMFVCQDSSTNHVAVSLGEVYEAALGSAIQLPITLHANQSLAQVGGFDLLMTYDPSGLVLEGASIGAALQACGWEYFTYRTALDSNCSTPPCPLPLLRLVALAEINNGEYHPSCHLTSGGELVLLRFRVNAGSDQLCRTNPVSFLWQGCDDNMLTNAAGDSLFLSREVFDYWGSAITADSALPSSTGAPSSCLGGAGAATVRFVDFINGFIRTECHPQIDYRGDLNLNGLSYEIADYVLFVNYFLNGPQVFTVNPPFQVATSDVNADGIPLKVADLEYMYRVIVGDALPFSRQPADSPLIAVFTQDTLTHTVAFESPSMLGAIHLVFVGAISPADTVVGGLGIAAVTDSGFTKIVIAPGLSGAPPPTGVPYVTSRLLFTYTGSGELVYADATYDGLQSIPTEIAGTSGICCWHRGNVEGWDDPHGQVDISDLTGMVDYLFASGFHEPPRCFGEADANNDAVIDVADVSALVEYLFSGVPLPPCH